VKARRRARTARRSAPHASHARGVSRARCDSELLLKSENVAAQGVHALMAAKKAKKTTKKTTKKGKGKKKK
jgi:hypothetical protein